MKTLTIALTALILGSCASSKNGIASEAALYEKEWKLTELNGKAIPASGEKTPSITFKKDGNKVSGYAGCNRMMGTFKLDGKVLNFSPLAATKMACIGDNVETEYLATLAKVNAFMITEGTLSLEEGETVIAKFK